MGVVEKVETDMVSKVKQNGPPAFRPYAFRMSDAGRKAVEQAAAKLGAARGRPMQSSEFIRATLTARLRRVLGRPVDLGPATG